ncbi:ectoine utilization protein EutA [Mesorhizobium xinjiangense]|uniref:ectoine utilization protein EutA n=1 Tax=Mesorhizobium xinjiangense TaxID=2678685 RepID=UPI0012ED7259|nr:ectoine utilization protein EutA [Mesorhizobium xinjiangense]
MREERVWPAAGGDGPALDARPVARRVGLVVLSTDHTTEPDFQRMVCREGVGVYANRVAFTNPINADSLRAMQPHLGEAAGLILPGEDLDAICYSCTSASVVIGDAEVAAAIADGKPGVPLVTPAAAAVRGLRALGTGRIAVLTPYTIETSRSVARYFEMQGLDVTGLTCLGMEDDRDMARIAPDVIVDYAVAAMAADSSAEALFISCTAMRAAAAVPAIEAATGKPVVTSNLATAWNCLRLSACEHPRPELGRLMAMALPKD